ncbi:MAG: hypothetical protein AB7L09_21540 [Nitrospira sp.]
MPNVPTTPNGEPVPDSLYHSVWDPERALQLAECITEAIHQDLDGWSSRDRSAIQRFLKDLGLALSHCPANWDRFNECLKYHHSPKGE